jgi:hypothetical protein
MVLLNRRVNQLEFLDRNIGVRFIMPVKEGIGGGVIFVLIVLLNVCVNQLEFKNRGFRVMLPEAMTAGIVRKRAKKAAINKSIFFIWDHP